MLLTVAAATTISALIIPIPLAGQIALAAGVAAAFIRALRHYTLCRGAFAARGLHFQRTGEVAVLGGDGDPVDFGKVVHRFVSPTLSAVVIAGNSRRYTVLLMPDSLSAEGYRRLRLRLNSLP